MSDTTAFDISEKTDVLLKTAFGFPSTDESKAWYEETAIPFNNYVPGEDILIDDIPSIPDFDTNGTIKTATSIGLTSSDFSNYSDSGSKSSCSIVDDSTGVVRRFQHIILDEVPQLSDTGLSWYKLDSSDNNVLKDAFQFNYKQYTDSDGNVVNPYQYVVNTESTVDKTTKLPSGGAGGNWFIDIKTGVLFFPDFNNLSSSSNNDFKISSTNKPALTIYVYVGQKGISNFTAQSSGSSDSSFNNNVDLSLNARLFTSGDVSLNNKLFVNDDVSFNNNLVIGGDLSVNDKLFVNNDVSLNSNLLIGGDLSVNDKLFVNNDVSFNGKLVVGGDVSFNGDLTINGNLEVYQQQNTSVINTTVNNYEVIITNDLSLNGNITVDGDASFNRVDICGNLYAQYPDSSIPSSAIIGGGSSFDNNSDLSLNADLFVGGDSSLYGNVDVCGNFYAQYPDNSIPQSAIIGGVGGGGGGGSATINNNGQTFYEVITQQPGQFSFDSSSNTTSSVTVNWNYDDIIGNRIGTLDRAFLTLFSGYQKYIPFIQKIYIDVSYSTVTNGWLNYKTINFSGTTDYNQNAYKTNTFTKNESNSNSSVQNLLTQVVFFDVRIYGENNATSYPTVDNRALIIEGISFKQAKPPGDPNFVSAAVNSNSQITLTYNFDEAEQNESSTTAVLDTVQTKYRENDTLSSTKFSLDNTTIDTDTETNKNTSEGNNFTSTLQNLRAGTKYDFISRIKNDLQINYNISDASWNNVPTDVAFDTNGPTAHTQLPGNTTTTTNPNANYLDWSDSTTAITTNSLSNSNQVYINLSGSQKMNANNSTQTFQISNPSANQNSTSGFGKYLDDEHNLISISASVDGSEKQRLTFDGFYPGGSDYDGSCNSTGTSTAFFNSPSQVDQYVNNGNKQGFRLNGSFSLKDIANNNIQTEIGSASSTPYSVNVTFTRNTSKVGGTATTSKTTNVYVDNLSVNPSRSAFNNDSEVKTVVYNMGIPNVATFNIDLTRTYSNINSQYGYIRGDRKLVTFSTISNVSGSSGGTIYINQNSIDTATPGQYSYGTNDFISSLDYSDGSASNGTLYHNTSRTSTSGFNATFTETVYSLKTSSSSSNSVTLDHFCDKNSFNGNGSSLSSKLTLTDIYEVDGTDISNLGSDLRSLTANSYTYHSTKVEDHTLLYINGLFRTNAGFTYPNTNDYAWDNVSITNNTYNAGSSGVNLSGGTTGTLYKWIAFKFNKLNTSGGTSSSGQYSFNGTTYSVLKDGNGWKYLSLKSMLVDKGLFNSSTMSKIVTSSDDVVGILKASKSSNNSTVIGNTKQGYSTTQFWIGNGTIPTTYSNMVDPNNADANKWSSYVSNGSDYGFYVDPTAINDDLILYVGLKNSASL